MNVTGNKLKDKVLNLVVNRFVPVPFVVEHSIKCVVECERMNAVDVFSASDDWRWSMATGSTAEGLSVPQYYQTIDGVRQLTSRDRDELTLNPNKYHLIDSSTGEEYTGTLFYLQPVSSSDPNYARLHVTQEYIDVCKKTNTTLRKHILLNTTVTGHGFDTYSSFFQQDSIVSAVEICGPAITLLSGHAIGPDKDNCHGVNFEYWPDVAEDFVTRVRPSGWPDRQLIQDIIAKGFQMTPIGRKNSDKKEEEWRYSFSVSERMLAHKISDVQRTVYVLVKLLHTFYFKEPAIFKTYFLKATLFWLCERIPRKVWRRDNINEMVRVFLEEIIQSLAKGHLQDYFIKDANLLKGTHVVFRMTLARKVRYIQDTLLESFLAIDKKIQFILSGAKAHMIFQDVIQYVSDDSHHTDNLHFQNLILTALEMSVSDRQRYLRETAALLTNSSYSETDKIQIKVNVVLFTDLILESMQFLHEATKKTKGNKMSFPCFMACKLLDEGNPASVAANMLYLYYRQIAPHNVLSLWFRENCSIGDFNERFQELHGCLQALDNETSSDLNIAYLYRKLIDLQIKDTLSQARMKERLQRAGIESIDTIYP